MTVIPSTYSGRPPISGNLITYVNMWSGLMGGAGDFVFYSHDIRFVVDVQVSAVNLHVGIYPHNREGDADPATGILSVEGNKKLEKYVKNHKLERGESFLYDWKRDEMVTFANFTKISADVETPGFYGYVRDTHGLDDVNTQELEQKFRFPHMFILDNKSASRDSLEVMTAQVFASRFLAEPAQPTTRFGKVFTNSLILSYLKGEFKSRVKHAAANVDYPTSPMSDEIPRYISTNILEVISEKSGADKFKATLIGDPNDIPNTEDFKASVERGVMDKQMINFTEVVDYGLSALLEFVGNLDKSIKINMDVENVAQDMWIVRGIVYVTPLSGIDFDMDILAGVDTDKIKIVGTLD